MKKISTIVSISLCIVIISCNGPRRDPGLIYMPDMYYSRAYETYTDHGNLNDERVNFTNMPVEGTIARGQDLPFPFLKDKPGDTINYVASKQFQSPLDTLNNIQFKEAERLYLVYCAICHGTKLDGNGPLYNNGKGPYPAAPKNFIGDPNVLKMPEGQMFYTATYGKGQMGSYASQVNRHQRWMIIRYIKTKQKEASAANETSAGTGSDSTATAKQ